MVEKLTYSEWLAEVQEKLLAWVPPRSIEDLDEGDLLALYKQGISPGRIRVQGEPEPKIRVVAAPVQPTKDNHIVRIGLLCVLIAGPYAIHRLGNSYRPPPTPADMVPPPHKSAVLPRPDDPPVDDWSDPWLCVKEAIQARIPNPRSAEFTCGKPVGFITDKLVFDTDVDFPNSSGVKTRAHWKCTVSMVGDHWKVLELKSTAMSNR